MNSEDQQLKVEEQFRSQAKKENDPVKKENDQLRYDVEITLLIRRCIL